MSQSIYVYVVEQGCYSSRGVVGVYASPEAAMDAHPITAELLKRYPDAAWTAAAWAEDGQMWTNGGDWEDAKDITRYEVQGQAEGRPEGPR